MNKLVLQETKTAIEVLVEVVVDYWLYQKSLYMGPSDNVWLGNSIMYKEMFFENFKYYKNTIKLQLHFIHLKYSSYFPILTDARDMIALIKPKSPPIKPWPGK